MHYRFTTRRRWERAGRNGSLVAVYYVVDTCGLDIDVRHKTRNAAHIDARMMNADASSDGDRVGPSGSVVCGLCGKHSKCDC